MGKLEVFGVALVVVAFAGLHRTEPPPEAQLLTTTEDLLQMSRDGFEAWCRKRGANPRFSARPGMPSTVACAWLDAKTARAWHAAIQLDGRSPLAVKADAGLVEASNELLHRLVHTSFGASDGMTGDGFPTWKLDVPGGSGRLTVAEFDDITVVRMSREDAPAVVSLR